MRDLTIEEVRATATSSAEQSICAAAEAVLGRRIAELEDALRPFAVYAAKRDEMPMLGLGDSVHMIHGGTEHEMEITMQHCREARRLLST